MIFFCDGSDMVSDSDFVTMTTFLSDLIDNFDIQSQRMKIGIAQFGSRYQEIIELQNSLTKTQWKSRIQTMTKSNGLPRMDLALKQVSVMFEQSAGGRRKAGVPQTLVVITSGSPRYDVTEAVKTLREDGICILALGIGNVYKEELLSITGNSEKIITFKDFDKLKNVDVKKRMVREICQSCGKTSECTLALSLLLFDCSFPVVHFPRCLWVSPAEHVCGENRHLLFFQKLRSVSLPQRQGKGCRGWRRPWVVSPGQPCPPM